MRVSALIVLYNKGIRDIACLGELVGEARLSEIVVCDNSTRPNDNGEVARDMGITYLSMGGNVGLPKAYNAGIDRCEGDVVCVFDDDTTICAGYFDALQAHWRTGGWDVLLPLVMANDLILSPSRFGGFRSRHYLRVDDITDDDPALSGINSGMVVRRSVFEDVRYDERLFLDFVDHKFISDAKERGFLVAYGRGMELRQDYSYADSGAEDAMRRLAIFERDTSIFYDTIWSRRAYCKVMHLYRRVRLCMRYRTPRFLAPGKSVAS